MRIPWLNIEVLAALRLLDLSMVTATILLLLGVTVAYEVGCMLLAASGTDASRLSAAMRLLLLVGLRRVAETAVIRRRCCLVRRIVVCSSS